MTYIWHIIVLVNIYVAAAAMLNLLAGYTGLVSLCTASFVGIGAYAVALLSAHGSCPWVLAVLAGAGLSAALAAIISIGCLRFRDDLFVIATFAFQVLLYSLALNWVELTGGSLGIANVSSPAIGGLQATQPWHYALLACVLSGASMWVLKRIVRSPYGRVLMAIREDERFARSLGKNVRRFRISVFMLSAAITSLVGSVYASYMTFISPQPFSVHESIFILSLVIFGGLGSLRGPMVGALILVGAPEVLRLIDLPSAMVANLRQILYGALLVACMIWHPGGLTGDREVAPGDGV